MEEHDQVVVTEENTKTQPDTQASDTTPTQPNATAASKTNREGFASWRESHSGCWFAVKVAFAALVALTALGAIATLIGGLIEGIEGAWGLFGYYMEEGYYRNLTYYVDHVKGYLLDAVVCIVPCGAWAGIGYALLSRATTGRKPRYGTYTTLIHIVATLLSIALSVAFVFFASYSMVNSPYELCAYVAFWVSQMLALVAAILAATFTFCAVAAVGDVSDQQRLAQWAHQRYKANIVIIHMEEDDGEEDPEEDNTKPEYPGPSDSDETAKRPGDNEAAESADEEPEDPKNPEGNRPRR